MTPAARTDPRLAGLEDEYPFESRTFELGGELRMHYVDEGPRDGAPVLFVHGNPTWSFLWRHPVRALRGTRRCLAVDHVGCGLSSKPARWSYRLEDHVANLERLVLELDLTEIDLVVHDWGGAIGMGVAVRHPERFRSFVVMNTAAFPGGRAPWRIRVCRVPVLGALAVRGFNAFAGLATHMAVERPLEPAAKRGLLLPYGDWHDRIATLRFVEDIPLSPSHPSHATLAAIDAGLAALRDKPMCLVWGARDWCFTLDTLEEWRRRFPDAEVHVEQEAGHYVLEDARASVLGTLQRFLAQVPAAR